MADFGDLSALSRLIEQSYAEMEDREGGAGQEPPSSKASWTPADLHHGAVVPAAPPQAPRAPAAAARDEKDIWDASEVPEATADVLDDEDDGRARPEYDIIMKQSVGTEDVFLGMSGKTPSSVSCDWLVVRVDMPGARLADIDLDVKRQSLTAQSPAFKLSIYLPHPVDPDRGKARWDSDKSQLVVDLPVQQMDPWMT